MSEYFDPSTRPSKRRRINQSRVEISPPIDTKTTSRSLLKTFSEGISVISAKLFEKKSSRQPTEQDHDSTYGSKEDSIAEEDEGFDVEPRNKGIGGSRMNMSDKPKVTTEDMAKATAANRGLRGRAGQKISDTSFENGTKGAIQIDSTHEDSDATTKRTSMARSQGGGTPQQAGINFGGLGPSGAQRSQHKRDDPRNGVNLQDCPTEAQMSSRSHRKGKRKAIPFHQDEQKIERQLGFKDIQSTPESPRERKMPIPEDKASTHSPKFLRSSGHAVHHVSYSEMAEDDQIEAIKSVVLGRLATKDLACSDSLHLENQYNSLLSLLTSTVASGESNSMLLIGSRGSGKSLLVKNALAKLSTDFPEDFHTVRLNGFVQTDDRLALREIWRQLGHEMQVPDEETSDTFSYADTMASLLGLLSHPDELQDTSLMQVDSAEGRTTTKSVIFVLDEFDLFTFHPRQTLLYNLFDIAQARKAPIAVIGCSARMDVVDCLEKRVKSRFSHRWLHIPAIKSLAGWEELLRDVLVVEVDEKLILTGKVKNEEELLQRRRWNDFVREHFIPSTEVQNLLKHIFYTSKSLPDLFAALYLPIATLSVPDPGSGAGVTATKSSKTKNQKSKAKESLKSATNTSQSSHTQSPTIIIPHIPPVTPPSSIAGLLPDLPLLHLSLLAAAARLEAIYDLPVVTFAAVHAHYRDLVARAKTQSTPAAGVRVWGKPVARRAWEDLRVWEVLIPAAAAASGGGGGFGKSGERRLGWGAGPASSGMEDKLWRVDVTLEEVGWGLKVKTERDKARGGGGVGEGTGLAGGAMGELVRKWCREV